MSHLNTSRAWPLSGDVSLKKGTTRDRLALRRDAPVPLALSATPPTKPPARVSAVVCFFKNFSSGFIPAGMVGRWVEGCRETGALVGGGGSLKGWRFLDTQQRCREGGKWLLHHTGPAGRGGQV